MRKVWLVLAVLVVTALTFAGTASARIPAQGGVAMLTGAAEVPPADLDGSGIAVVFMDPRSGFTCWNIKVSGIGPVILDHIHNAPAGTNGPIVLDFMGRLSGCTFASPVLLAAILENPQNYYVNVHTAEFPAGAVRGQLQPFRLPHL